MDKSLDTIQRASRHFGQLPFHPQTSTATRTCGI